MAYNAEYYRQWRERNREKRRQLNRESYHRRLELSRLRVRQGARKRRGLSGAGISLTQTRVSLWARRSRAQLMDEWIYQHGRDQHETWFAELDNESEAALGEERERCRAAAETPATWYVEACTDESGRRVWRTRRGVLPPADGFKNGGRSTLSIRRSAADVSV